MKTKIKVSSKLNNNEIKIEKEHQQRNLMHLQVQLNTHSTKIQPKKGKGSYKRNKKEDDYDD